MLGLGCILTIHKLNRAKQVQIIEGGGPCKDLQLLCTPHCSTTNNIKLFATVLLAYSPSLAKHVQRKFKDFQLDRLGNEEQGSRIQNSLSMCQWYYLPTGVMGVMPSCAYPGFLRILLCGFSCLLSLCISVTSGSPHKHILLLALLIYDSTHVTLLQMLLCATPTFS